MTNRANEPKLSRRIALYGKWAAITVVTPLIIGFCTYQLLKADGSDLTGFLKNIQNLTKQTTPEILPQLEPAPKAALNETIEFVVRRNDTMEKIFRQLELSLNDLAAINALPEVKKALTFLKPGDPVTFTQGADGSLQGLSRQVSLTSRLSVIRDGDTFKAELVETPLTVEQTTVDGKVDSSFFSAARKAGLSADLIMEIANNIFGWDVDFALDIQPGDSFKITYERQYRDGHYVADGKILAAEFINDGKTYRAIHYDSTDGQISNYFTPEGRSMHKQFLRAPVDFTRISSGFSLARFHPILNRIRAHKGVDYAAPTGTPIKAAGDGKLTFQGVQNGYGNVVIVDHGGGITTLYGHMSRFNTNLHNGSRVQQGDVIGYVGSTGAATGPHLHYEYRINGVYKDPRTIPLPNASPIPTAYMAEFKQQANRLLATLQTAAPASSLVKAK